MGLIYHGISTFKGIKLAIDGRETRGNILMNDGNGNAVWMSPVEAFLIWANESTQEKEHLKFALSDIIEKLNDYMMLVKLSTENNKEE